MALSVCCHPKILLPWQRDVTTSPLHWEEIELPPVSFFDVIFDVYTHMDNRERARVSVENNGNEFRRKKNINIS